MSNQTRGKVPNGGERTLKRIIAKVKELQISGHDEQREAVGQAGMLLISELNLDAAIRLAQGRWNND